VQSSNAAKADDVKRADFNITVSFRIGAAETAARCRGSANRINAGGEL
jgi:hypothetical protein